MFCNRAHFCYVSPKTILYERCPIPASAVFKRVCGLSKGKWCVLDLWLCHDAKHLKLSSQSWAGLNPAVSQPCVTARPSFHFWLHHESALQRRYIRALITFAFSWTGEASWCDVSSWTLVQREPTFVFLGACVITNATTGLNPGEHIHTHTKMKTHPCVCSAQFGRGKQNLPAMFEISKQTFKLLQRCYFQSL